METQVIYSTCASIRKKGLATRCPVLGCSATPKKIKLHCAKHFPLFLRETVNLELDENMLEKERFHALQILAEYLLGSGAQVSSLVTMVNAEQLPDPQKSEITKNSCVKMVSMCKFQGWEVPQQFSLNRVTT